MDQGGHTILAKHTTVSEAAALRDDLRSYLVVIAHGEPGGRGLMLLRSVSTALEYSRTPEGQNRLTVTVSRDATARVRMSDGARSGD